MDWLIRKWLSHEFRRAFDKWMHSGLELRPALKSLADHISDQSKSMTDQQAQFMLRELMAACLEAKISPPKIGPPSTRSVKPGDAIDV